MKTLLLLYFCLFLAWHIYIARYTLYTVITYILNVILGQKKHLLPSFIYYPKTGELIIYLQIYRYFIYILSITLIIYSLIKFTYKKEIKVLFLVGVIIFFGSYIINFISKFGVDRFIYYDGIIAALISSHTLTLYNKSKKGKKYMLKIIKYITPIFVISTFIVSNLYGSIYINFIHSDEIYASHFIANKINGSISSIIDETYVIKYFSFNRNNLNIIAIDDKDPINTVIKKFEQSKFNLQYLPRQIFYFTMEFIENKNNILYSNGLTRLSQQL